MTLENDFFSPKGYPALKTSVMQLSTSYFSEQGEAKRYVKSVIIKRKGQSIIPFAFFTESNQWVNLKFIDVA